MKEIAVLLHNVRSAHNVGSIFRTADAAGVSHIYLSGYTPKPLDRFGRAQKEIAKTALGAEKTVSWKYVPTPLRLIERLKSENWSIVGVEQDTRAKDYRTIHSSGILGIGAKGRIVFAFGNEVRGLSKRLRDACDALVEIPMREVLVRDTDHPRCTKRGKESLNVAVAAGIILFSIQ